ncbi:DUF6799 domain-containing protein [Hymenobacter cheonanensis]|uniref:DUF6799 domain-containing protein n=1 Tax=Hymenobacter sp. CA2-7 TaxID=3063993 RepID=UPI0027125885|nr:DUF6799 domain-containing protein [Hymenobacter sp. CA2-7]MDO7883841.1 hypothetical protein [Hymenobacter sp. CA2-7]
MPTLRVAGLACLLLPLGRLACAQQPPNNDGFQRRNGQMQVVRNGQPRPMTHDARLPTGAVVTKDGFIIAASGQRTELREGQGCDLRGRPVAVRTSAAGALALASPAAPARPVPRRAAPSVLEALFGPGSAERGYFFNGKKWKKHHGKGHGKAKGHWKEEGDD